MLANGADAPGSHTLHHSVLGEAPDAHLDLFTPGVELFQAELPDLVHCDALGGCVEAIDALGEAFVSPGEDSLRWEAREGEAETRSGWQCLAFVCW